MDWNLFWSAFGAIGTTVGSLITGVAVVVAVKQYKQPLEKKIVVSYGTTLPIMTDNSMGSYHLFIDAKNLGVRDTTITGFYFYTKKRKYFLNNMQSPFIQPIALPCVLHQEDCITFQMDMEKVEQELISLQQRRVLKQRQKLYACVQDAVGQIYICHKTIRFYHGKFK